MPIKTEPI